MANLKGEEQNKKELLELWGRYHQLYVTALEQHKTLQKKRREEGLRSTRFTNETLKDQWVEIPLLRLDDAELVIDEMSPKQVAALIALIKDKILDEKCFFQRLLSRNRADELDIRRHARGEFHYFSRKKWRGEE